MPRLRPSVAPWQRGLLVAVFLLAVLGAVAPSRLNSGAVTSNVTAFTDTGRPQVEPPGRVSAQRWTAGAPLPAPRNRLALASDGKRIYAIGGETADGVTGEVAIYDPKTNGWLPGANKPTPVANVAAGVLDGRVYVAGGSTANGGVSDVVEIYDPAADAWTNGPALPRPLAAYAAAVWNGKLYLFGGWDGSAYRKETLIFDPATSAWTQGPAMPGPRAFAGAATVKDTIYLAGGTNGRGNLTDLLAFDPRGDAAEGAGSSPWQAKAPMKEPRAGLGVVSVGNQLFAMGGSRDNGDTFNEQYDARLDAWSRLGTPIAGAWRNLAAAQLNNKVHVVGGWSGAYLDVHEQYAALVQLLIPLTGTH